MLLFSFKTKLQAKKEKENGVDKMMFIVFYFFGTQKDVFSQLELQGRLDGPKRRLLSWTTKEKEMIFAKNEQEKGIVDLIRQPPTESSFQLVKYLLYIYIYIQIEYILEIQLQGRKEEESKSLHFFSSKDPIFLVEMWLLGWKGPSGFSGRSTAEEVTRGIDGSGLTAIITGLLISYLFMISFCFFSP